MRFLCGKLGPRGKLGPPAVVAASCRCNRLEQLRDCVVGAERRDVSLLARELSDGEGKRRRMRFHLVRIPKFLRLDLQSTQHE